jgi:hypothetical protein
VHTEGLVEPLVASRSEKAILADMDTALAAPDAPHRRRLFVRRVADQPRRRQSA